MWALPGWATTAPACPSSTRTSSANSGQPRRSSSAASVDLPGAAGRHDRHDAVGGLHGGGVQRLIAAHHADRRDHLADQHPLPVQPVAARGAGENVHRLVQVEAGAVAVAEEGLARGSVVDRQVQPVSEASSPPRLLAGAVPRQIELGRVGHAQRQGRQAVRGLIGERQSPRSGMSRRASFRRQSRASP